MHIKYTIILNLHYGNLIIFMRLDFSSLYIFISFKY